MIEAHFRVEAGDQEEHGGRSTSGGWNLHTAISRRVGRSERDAQSHMPSFNGRCYCALAC